MGKKSPPPKPPDLTPISNAQIQISEEANEIAREQMGISREQFAWYQSQAQEELALAREQADRLFGQQERAYESDQQAQAFARQVGQTQIDAMNLQMDYAKRDRARYEGVYLPMEDRYIADANAYDTQQRREAEASRAMVDVQRQAEASRNEADMRLRSMGVDPSQVRSSSMANQFALATGANQALAGNNARTMVEDKGRALRADAINMGKGLPAQAAMGFQGAGNSGNAAMGAAQAGQAATLGAIQGGAGVAGTAMGFRSGALNNVAALTGTPMQWAGMSGNMMNTAMSGYGQAANTINSGYQNQMQAWQAKQQQAQQGFNNIMSVAGMAAGMMMAEGGEVKRPAISTMDLPRDKFTFEAPGLEAAPELRTPSRMDRWRQRYAEMNPDAPKFIRPGAGSGEGGALSMVDRFRNGMAGAQSYQGSNLFQKPYMAEGGMMRPRPMQRRGPMGGAMGRGAPGNTGPLPPGFGRPMQMPISTMPTMPNRPMPMPMMQSGALAMAEGGTPRVVPVRQSRDKYQALLTEGEYVVPADVVRSVGVEKLDKMVAKYHRENS